MDTQIVPVHVDLGPMPTVVDVDFSKAVPGGALIVLDCGTEIRVDGIDQLRDHLERAEKELAAAIGVPLPVIRGDGWPR